MKYPLKNKQSFKNKPLGGDTRHPLAHSSKQTRVPPLFPANPLTQNDDVTAPYETTADHGLI
jgi:hypothetical protein